MYMNLLYIPSYKEEVMIVADNFHPMTNEKIRIHGRWYRILDVAWVLEDEEPNQLSIMIEKDVSQWE